jgi:mRNA interferase RelE/StbE
MWQVKIHRLVIEEDFRKIPEKKRTEILKTIRKKLGTEPERFGVSLRYELKGFRKLRVGDYRVIYLIEKQEIRVLVLKIGIRRDSEVYLEMQQRLKKL